MTSSNWTPSFSHIFIVVFLTEFTSPYNPHGIRTHTYLFTHTHTQMAPPCKIKPALSTTRSHIYIYRGSRGTSPRVLNLDPDGEERFNPREKMPVPTAYDRCAPDPVWCFGENSKISWACRVSNPGFFRPPPRLITIPTTLTPPGPH